MTTKGMKGLGQRHRQFGVNDLSAYERSEAELAATRRALARTQAERDALRGALSVAAKVLRPYAATPVANGKPRPSTSAWRTTGPNKV